MSENGYREPPSNHDGLPQPPKDGRRRGSLVAGAGLFWGVVLLGRHLLSIFRGVFVPSGYANVGGPVFLVLIVGVLLALAGWLSVRGRWRTVVGMALGLVSLIAVILAIFMWLLPLVPPG